MEEEDQNPYVHKWQRLVDRISIPYTCTYCIKSVLYNLKKSNIEAAY